MKRRNLEIVFNNGELRQILMLPETPLKIIFLFPEKELILCEKLSKHGLYVISHQKGFSEADANYESDQELSIKSQDEPFHVNQSQSDLESNSSEESSYVPHKRQFLNGATFEKIANFMKSLNDLQAINEKNSNSDSLALRGAESTSMTPSEKSVTEINATKNVTCDERLAICKDIIYSQPKKLTSNEIAKQSKVLTVHHLSTKINNPILCQTERMTNQNELTTDNNTQSKTNATYSNSNQSKINNESEHNQDKNTSAMKAECNSETSLSVSMSDDDATMDFGFSCSDMSDDEDGNLNTLNKDCSSGSVVQNKSSQICNSEGEDEQGTTNASSNANCQKKKYMRKCAICLTNGKQGKLFYRFPTCPERSNKWAKVSGRKWILKATPRERWSKYRLCSNHFKETDFMGSSFHRLKPEAVPTLNLPKFSEYLIEEQQNAEIFGRLRTKLMLSLHKPDVEENNLQKCRKSVATKSRLFLPHCDITCCVPKCTSSRSKCPEYRFYYFPPKHASFNVKINGVKVSINLRQEWIRLLKIEKPVTDQMRVCSRHFLESDFTTSGSEFLGPQLKRNVIPTQYLPSVLSGSISLRVQNNLESKNEGKQE